MTTSKIFDVMHLSDSFFPTGLYANSNGLEKLYLEKKITKPGQLFDYIKTILNYQIAPTDCIILSESYDAAESSDYCQLTNLDIICCHTKIVKETRDAAIRSGVQLTKCVCQFSKEDLLGWYLDSINDSKLSGVYPVSFGVCCNKLNISKQDVLSMFLYGFTVSMVGAALRLGMIQHFDSQKIIHKLKPLLADIVKDYTDKTVEDIWQFCPQTDIFQMKHEKMSSKMFIT